MSRQRTINDQRFWRNPALQHSTTEDKIALLHLLTCPDSNIIGAYPVVPRIVGAELGWTQDQWLHVIDRLKVDDLVWFDSTKMFVWVRIWWDHHLASQALGSKLRGRTLENLRRLPESWQQPYLSDFKTRLSDDLMAILDAAWAGTPIKEAVSVPYRYGMDMRSDLSPSNNNANDNFNFNLTPTLGSPSFPPVDNYGVPAKDREVVEAAIAKAQRAGIARADAHAVWEAVGKRFQSKRPPQDAGAYAYVLAQTLNSIAQSTAPHEASEQELVAWKGRCFCWPSDNPTNFIRIEENGFFEQYSQEGGRLSHGHAPLGRGKLLADLREGRLREVSPTVFSGIAKDSPP